MASPEIKRRNNPLSDGSLALKIEKRRQERQVVFTPLQRGRGGESLIEEARQTERRRAASLSTHEAELGFSRGPAHKREERLREIAKKASLEREEETKLRRATKEKQGSAKRAVLAALFATLTLVGCCSFFLLTGQARVEALLVESHKLSAQVRESEKRISELELSLNAQSDVNFIQEYARENLGMDYPSVENTRVISLRGE
jgi:cell division protein FtsL